jgi:hypothetical protein
MADKKISQLSSASTPLAGTEVLPIVQSSATVKVSAADITAGRAVSALSYTATSGYTFRAANNTSYEVLRYVGGSNNPGLYTKVVESTKNAHLFASGSLVSGQFLCLGAQAVEDVVKINNVDATLTYGNLIQGTAAKGINFTANTPAAGMTSQLLNWYEEGTWTPTNNSMTVNSGSWAATGTYTRIGRTVFYSVVQTSGTVSATSGVGMIDGFPFTPARPVSCTYSNSAGTLSGVGLLETNSVFYGADAFVSQTALRFSGTYQV